MQGITRQRDDQALRVVLYGLVVLSVLGLALVGQTPEEAAGWLVRPVVLGTQVRRRPSSWVRYRTPGQPVQVSALRQYLAASWPPVLLRSLLLWGLWAWSGAWGGPWLGLLPWALWLWRGVGMGWPRWRQQAAWLWVGQGLWQVQRLVLLGYLGLALSQHRWGEQAPWCLGLGCLVCQQDEPRVAVVRQTDGSYQATLCGHFTLTVAGDHAFRLRLLVVFLSLLDVPDLERGSRRTRDGRTPFVRQLQLAEWLGVPQPRISQWLRYWLAGDWADLLSLHSPQVLTAELVERIVEVCASFPTWSVAQVHQHLRRQGLAVTEAQVQQAVAGSGWQRLQRTLWERYDLGRAAVGLRESWLVGQLLAQVRELLERLESGQPLVAEVRTALADLTTLATATGVPAPPPLKTAPWLLRVEQLLAGREELLTDGQVRCPACGSAHVGRKSVRPRSKTYYDATGQVCRIAVYRYYCHNPQCGRRSFTHLPPGLVPYSRYRSEVHVLALQMYAWGYSTYRRTGSALGVASLTAWRWVSAWGQALLPVAALFGVVRSSGVVGVDEKYVLVPKNDKPTTKLRRWMYAYFAVDVWTYDLLHIAIYPYNDQASAQAFLLALRAKGYHPQVIITDLRQDYGLAIAQAFPQALHHECIFHALQTTQQHIKDIYGARYAEQYPQAEQLKQQIYRIFDAETLALATERYTTVLAQRQPYVQALAETAVIFDFLERHWAKLANSIGCSTIPATNNAVELVIRRFEQHYHNFCGFDSITHAQGYLAVFEKLYRFTPFSQDAQPAIRGKCPLQLAGYDLSHLPMTTLCAGLSIIWPIQTDELTDVPNLSR